MPQASAGGARVCQDRLFVLENEEVDLSGSKTECEAQDRGCGLGIIL